MTNNAAGEIMPAAAETRVDFRAMGLDLAERIIVSLLLGLLAMRFLPSIVDERSYLNLLLFLSEAMVVAFILFRRPAKTMSKSSTDWFFGFTGTFLPLLAFPAGPAPLAHQGLIVLLMVSGFILQLWAKLTLRRSFGVVAANRGVKASGPYRLVRHPMYAGYILTHIGFLLSGPILWNVILYLALWCIMLMRIHAEERILRSDPVYLQLSKQVRYRMIPCLY